MKKRLVGQHIVIDPEICHGTPTFRGTRVFVSDVLNDVARGRQWDEIVVRWHNSITPAAISEVVRLANEVFDDHIHDYVLEPASASIVSGSGQLHSTRYPTHPHHEAPDCTIDH